MTFLIIRSLLESPPTGSRADIPLSNSGGHCRLQTTELKDRESQGISGFLLLSIWKIFRLQFSTILNLLHNYFNNVHLKVIICNRRTHLKTNNTVVVSEHDLKRRGVRLIPLQTRRVIDELYDGNDKNEDENYLCQQNLKYRHTEFEMHKILDINNLIQLRMNHTKLSYLHNCFRDYRFKNICTVTSSQNTKLLGSLGLVHAICFETFRYKLIRLIAIVIRSYSLRTAYVEITFTHLLNNTISGFHTLSGGNLSTCIPP
ncbi:hypothetical protein AGLY_000596 [Aphis glycines]|uniref:Uncharacterized protein n=1 Tax=Aphis glycines TaxID=307491 RepID=A0A6G0U7X6_APHGL|nr:hypothetical protein AGLY_000596 [Aphis glycines]